MEAIFQSLEKIYALLDQIYSITQNQMTILLETQYAGDGLTLIEQMATYKENLTKEVEEEETIFQVVYHTQHDRIQDTGDKKRLKEAVDRIMKLKTQIMEAEHKNVLIMQDLLKRMSEPIEMPKSAKRVVAAYQNNTKKL